MAKTLVEMAADIVQAQSGTHRMSTEEMQDSLVKTFETLKKLQQIEAGEQSVEDEVPAQVNRHKSILKNKIICLECGEAFKMLSPKHLLSHGLTPREYRVKYDFSLRQPLCAKSLSDLRKKAGKERGLPEALKKAIAAKKKKASAKGGTRGKSRRTIS